MEPSCTQKTDGPLTVSLLEGIHDAINDLLLITVGKSLVFLESEQESHWYHTYCILELLCNKLPKRIFNIIHQNQIWEHIWATLRVKIDVCTDSRNIMMLTMSTVLTKIASPLLSFHSCTPWFIPGTRTSRRESISATPKFPMTSVRSHVTCLFACWEHKAACFWRGSCFAFFLCKMFAV